MIWSKAQTSSNMAAFRCTAARGWWFNVVVWLCMCLYFIILILYIFWF